MLLFAFLPEGLPQAQHVPHQQRTSTHKTSGLLLVLGQREIRERGVSFKYPEIAHAGQFNAAVHQILDPLVEAARKENSGPGQPDCPDHHYSIDGRYTATILENGIVSVLLDWTEYTPCAAHPGGSMASVNYDPSTGRVLALSDLFKPGVNYLSRLSELAITSMEEYDPGEDYTIRRGAGPVESNFKVFTLMDHNLVLHFPTYQVMAGAAGPQDVIILLGMLAPLLRNPRFQ
jgi:hypothetical protein